MNTDNNRRFQETEKRITEAYGNLVCRKDPLKITVRDICEEAGIHRTTFYGHFQDMPELMMFLEKQNIQRMLAGFEKEGKWNLREGLLVQLQFYYNNRAIIRRQMNSEKSSGNFFEFYDLLREDAYRRSYMRTFGCKTDREFAYHQAYFNAGFAAIIRKWVTSDCQESPEEIVSYIIKFFRFSQG